MDFHSAAALAGKSPAITADDIVYAREPIDPDHPEWQRHLELINRHARELRGMDASLDLATYKNLQDKHRLVIVSARRRDTGELVGYSSHLWYDDLHFQIRLATDDAWYVLPNYRRLGIGRRLREKALEELAAIGVKIALARTKTDAPHDRVMIALGYRPYEIVHRKDL